MIDAPVGALSLNNLMRIDARIEIIGGKVVEMTAAGAAHNLIGQNVFRAITSVVDEARDGVVFTSGMHFLMNSDLSAVQTMFVPDCSYNHLTHLPPKGWDNQYPHPGLPNFAVEVIAPGDDAQLVQRKVRTYLEKGTEHLLIIYPATRAIMQYRTGKPITLYRDSGPLDLDDLFPGLVLTLEQIFSLPEWVIL
jgi:Uma2 family endonuclease